MVSMYVGQGGHLVSALASFEMVAVLRPGASNIFTIFRCRRFVFGY